MTHFVIAMCKTEDTNNRPIWGLFCGVVENDENSFNKATHHFYSAFPTSKKSTVPESNVDWRVHSNCPMSDAAGNIQIKCVHK